MDTKKAPLSKDARAKTDAFVAAAVGQEWAGLIKNIMDSAGKGDSKYAVPAGVLTQAEGVCKLLADDGFGYKFEPNGDLIIRW